jgi:serine protease Do
MPRFSRFLLGAAAFAALLTAPLHALTVDEMKAMESKVKTLVAKNMPAVVGLVGDKVPGAGSGIVVSADGLILTAAHVSKGNVVMDVYFPNGKNYKGKVLGADYTRDVSLLKIVEEGTYPFVEVGDSDKLEPTTMVVALGHPGGYDPRRTPPVRIGRISDKNMAGFLVSDCTLVSGDSGGPLFDLEGKVIGIHSSISQSLGFNRDAPVNAAKADWTRMLAGENWGALEGFANNRPGRGGRKPAEQPELKERAVLGAMFDTRSTEGVEVSEVQERSPIAAAGMENGDILLKLGDRDVKTTKDLTERLKTAKPGDKLEAVYTRDGQEHKTEITLISQTELERRRRDLPKGR